MTKIQRIVCGVLLATASLSPLHAMSIDLGVAGSFNAYVLGDMESHYSDVEGTLAVGGDLTLSNYSVGLQLGDAYNNRDTLVVGGELNFTDGRVHHGNARSGLTAALDASVGFYTGSDPSQTNGSFIPGNPLDFSSINNSLYASSSLWAGYATNGESQLSSYNELTLTGTDNLLNVFMLSAFDLSSANTLYINAPEESRVLINVAGADAGLSGYGTYRYVNGSYVRIPDNKPGWKEHPDDIRHDGKLTENILFNFYEALTLDISSVGVKGSVLAPWAETLYYDAHVDGNLVVGGIAAHSGYMQCDPSDVDRKYCSGQTNLYPFKSYNTVSEPSTLAMLLLVGSGLLLSGVRRKKNQHMGAQA